MNTFLHALQADGPAGPHGGSVRATGELHFPAIEAWRSISHDGGATWAFEEQMLATRADMLIAAVGV